MDAESARAFLAKNHRAVLATQRADGTTQLSPVVAAVDDDGFVIVSTTEGSVKVRHLRQRPRAALCILNDGFFGTWAQVEGTAQIVPLPDAMDGLVDYYRRVSGEHPDWADYRAAMERDRRVLLRIPIERAGPAGG